MNRRYATPEAFRQALEERLRTRGGAQWLRHRQLLVFDRFLARAMTTFGNAAILKGGLVLELRLQRARTTRDIDLRLVGPPEGLVGRLQEAGRLELQDFMRYEVRPDDEHPVIQNEGMQYEGKRFRVECTIGGRRYGDPFGVDVAFGDPILGEPDVKMAADVLAFAGIAPPQLRLYPVETHIAEKLHAYTLPRRRPNTRVKDLPDLALLASTGGLDAARLRTALRQTFSFRKTHELPARLPDPPAAWSAPYAAMAREDQLLWPELDELTAVVRAFLDPVLAGDANAMWSPQAWAWRSPS